MKKLFFLLRLKRFWFFVLATVFLCWTFWPMGSFVIVDGDETTKVVGYGEGELNRTNYYRYFNDKYGKDLKAEDNAGVWLSRVMGHDEIVGAYGSDDEDGVDDHMVGEFYRLMKIEPLKVGDGGFVGWDRYLETVDDDEVYVVLGAEVCEDADLGRWGGAEFSTWMNDRKGKLSAGVWSKGEYVYGDRWLRLNEKYLEMYVRGSRCDTFFWPRVGEDGKHLMLVVLLPHLSGLREGGLALEIRANLRMGEGDLKGAIGDGLAIVRMGRLLRLKDEHTLITHLVGMSLEKLGFELLHRVSKAAGFTVAMGEGILHEVGGLGGAKKMVDVLDMGERKWMLDTVQAICVGDMSLNFLGGLVGSGDWELEEGRAVMDGNVVLRDLNVRYDEMLAKLNEGNAVGGGQLGDVKMMMGRMEELSVLPRRWRGEMLERAFGDFVFEQLLSATDTARRAEQKILMAEALLGVGFALEDYKRVHGVYPKKIGEIEGLLLPMDLLGKAGARLKYRLMKDGTFRVWSAERGGGGQVFVFQMGDRGVVMNVLPVVVGGEGSDVEDSDVEDSDD